MHAETVKVVGQRWLRVLVAGSGRGGCPQGVVLTVAYLCGERRTVDSEKVRYLYGSLHWSVI